ncbi:NAD-dependent epimerase/dehydratase family protein [Roseovarius amoyensis]|uniref:NAD-dependent epimerase/dehydratase family protein n=1 Tax=Roseovarius amoyensis TaxID=2211448 RepID=UPI0013A6CDBA|nr:NAD-dependent epimerase/dehydratase family protein [Roseovarius amoyensis]
MTVVVVGASGTVGRLLVPHWQSTSAPVLLQYRGTISPWTGGKVLKWNPDDGADALERWVSSHERASCMIVLAGVTPRSGKTLSDNTRIAEACLTAARSVAIPRALVASSSAVYGDYLDRPFSEEDDPHPMNAYGTAKLVMEKECERLAAPDLQVTCLRIGNVAGADALLSQIGTSGDRQPVIDQFNDGGTPLRSYIGPGTLAEVLLKLAHIRDHLPPILNVGAPVPVQMGELAEAAGLRWCPRPKPDARLQRITLDCGRLWALMHGQPQTSDPAEMSRQLSFSKAYA